MPGFRLILRSALVALLVSAAACAGPSSRVSRELEVAGQTDGWIVGTIGAADAPPLVAKGSGFKDHYLYFRSLSGGGVGSLAFSKGELFGMNKDINADGIAADVFVQRLPAGVYELIGAKFRASYGSFGSPPAVGTRPAVFVVRPGQVTYIGSLVGYTLWKTGLLGRFPMSGYFVVSDAAARDMPLILRKAPELPRAIRVEVIDPGEGNPPVLKRELPPVKE